MAVLSNPCSCWQISDLSSKMHLVQMTLTIVVSSKIQAWGWTQAYLKIITFDFSPTLVSLVYKLDTILFKGHYETLHFKYSKG